MRSNEWLACYRKHAFFVCLCIGNSDSTSTTRPLVIKIEIVIRTHVESERCHSHRSEHELTQTWTSQYRVFNSNSSICVRWQFRFPWPRGRIVDFESLWIRHWGMWKNVKKTIIICSFSTLNSLPEQHTSPHFTFIMLYKHDLKAFMAYKSLFHFL